MNLLSVQLGGVAVSKGKYKPIVQTVTSTTNNAREMNLKELCGDLESLIRMQVQALHSEGTRGWSQGTSLRGNNSNELINHISKMHTDLMFFLCYKRKQR